eukprot:gnl/MRDRNA2_/MRDRNA2_96465_c0_seq1.p1 gnl/MRDRNA2_/MRDRNA2_96465_c0~~gnl/MRDRNA2_/MRDRNA2_96465_c0_seq1.p1  ORF type:complete len:708 (+),score=140.53 gnl/MRDRNA2_/MRDRNA2_96465_c0_seq1:84-2207(+)
MSPQVFGHQKSEPVPKGHKLPNLLETRRRPPPCEISNANVASKGMCRESVSPDAQHFFKISKSLGIQEMESADSMGMGPSDHAVASDLVIRSEQCHKAFPLKAAPLKRWRAASKIQSYLSKWLKNEKGSSRNNQVTPQDPIQNSCKDQAGPGLNPLAEEASLLYWPEEPNALTAEDLDALTELESMLLENHGTMAAAYKFITNTVRNPGHDEPDITQREFRIALHLKACKDSAIPGSPGWNRLEQMFGRVLRLLRKHNGDVSKAEFLRLPELLNCEKALQERAADANKELVIGNRLRQRLVSNINGPEDALEIFQKAAVALQLEPTRTTNILFQIADAPANLNGLTLAISNIMGISHEFAGPKHGMSLDLLLSSWALCTALAKHVITLDVQPKPPSIKNPTKSVKPSKSKIFSRSKSQYQRKVDVCLESSDDQNKGNEHECNMAFWKGLLISDTLWNLGCGAEVLNDEEFETLLHSAWGLFEDFDAIACLLGPVGWGRLRPQLDALRGVKLEAHLLAKDSERARSELRKASLLLQHVASMCQADPRLARICALHGVSFLADRMRSTANASVNFADGAVASAAAQVNRSAAALNEELRVHVEELLEGRKVECCFKSGNFKIVQVPRTTASDNAQAQIPQHLTPQVEAKARAKQERVRPTSAEPHKYLRKGDRSRPTSATSAHGQKRARPASATSRSKRVKDRLFGSLF